MSQIALNTRGLKEHSKCQTGVDHHRSTSIVQALCLPYSGPEVMLVLEYVCLSPRHPAQLPDKPEPSVTITKHCVCGSRRFVPLPTTRQGHLLKLQPRQPRERAQDLTLMLSYVRRAAFVQNRTDAFTGRDSVTCFEGWKADNIIRAVKHARLLRNHVVVFSTWI